MTVPRLLAAVTAGMLLVLTPPTADASSNDPGGHPHGAALLHSASRVGTGPKTDNAICYYGACYNYVDGYQYVDGTGASVSMDQAHPKIDRDDADSHSLQELAVQSSDALQIVEIGWTVDRGLYGDTLPHLFTYHWVDGQPTCYDTCGFVSTNQQLKPGMRVTPNQSGTFGIENRGGDWWITYDGQDLGYYPGSLWGGRYTRFGLVQTFGEVASHISPTCVDMGNGKLGTVPQSSWIDDYRLSGTTASPALTEYSTSSDLYVEGFTTPTSFHLGGRGGGTCNSRSS